MIAVNIVQLILELEPAIQTAVTDLVQALHSKDVLAERKALEAALRLQFEARQAKPAG